MTVFPYALDNKRYHTLNYYNKTRYGGKVFKASLDGGLSCPNRTDGAGGCVFCDSGSRYFTSGGNISEQMEAEVQRIHGKWPDAKVIAYFQAGTNTYAPPEKLREMWKEALTCPHAVGLSIATRADCLGENVMVLLEEFHRRTDLTVELGLQTVHDETAKRIGRGHTYETFLEGYRRLKQAGIRVCVHLIDGLPGEDEAMMLETARQMGRLRPDGVKLHLLHVNRETPLETLWRRGGYVPMGKDEYVCMVAEQLRYFPVETVIERLTGDGDKARLLAPLWSRDKISVLGAIDQRMQRENILQGDRFEE